MKKYKSLIKNNPEHVYLKKPNVSGEFLPLSMWNFFKKIKKIWFLSNLESNTFFYKRFEFFYFIQCEAWGKYSNRSRGKLDFKGPSGKDYRTHGLN